MDKMRKGSARIEFFDGSEVVAVVETNGGESVVRQAARKYRALVAAGLKPTAVLTDHRGTAEIAYALREIGRFPVAFEHGIDYLRKISTSRAMSFAAVAEAEAKARATGRKVGFVLPHIMILVDGKVDAIFEKRSAKFVGVDGGWICAALEAFLAARRRFFKSDVRAVMLDEDGEIDLSEFFTGQVASEFRTGWPDQHRDLRIAAQRLSSQPLMQRCSTAA